MDEPCCGKFDSRYGCPEEICPGCFCSKEHEQNVCDECHTYNLACDFKPYLAKYGKENKRGSQAR